MNICSLFQRLHQNFQFIRKIENSNRYRYNFIESIIGDNLNSYLTQDKKQNNKITQNTNKRKQTNTTENIIVNVIFVGIVT